jgi:D-glycero-D-manno-heptose 1,7-bisphosphate phosphatase
MDRDGVLNRAILRDGKPFPPATLAELRVLAGVRDACRRLHEAGFALVLITNQPDIARGTITAEQVAAINRRLQRFLGLDDIRVCPHAFAHRRGGYCCGTRHDNGTSTWHRAM